MPFFIVKNISVQAMEQRIVFSRSQSMPLPKYYGALAMDK